MTELEFFGGRIKAAPDRTADGRPCVVIDILGGHGGSLAAFNQGGELLYSIPAVTDVLGYDLLASYIVMVQETADIEDVANQAANILAAFLRIDGAPSMHIIMRYGLKPEQRDEVRDRIADQLGPHVVVLVYATLRGSEDLLTSMPATIRIIGCKLPLEEIGQIIDKAVQQVCVR
ncbi:MAG TPA: hypothetical protein VLF91_05240 [Candidatus Saccharimonadales bacterium]|nr:hypothetical protein [Candidatus Saccharimonadales bacterium]